MEKKRHENLTLHLAKCKLKYKILCSNNYRISGYFPPSTPSAVGCYYRRQLLEGGLFSPVCSLSLEQPQHPSWARAGLQVLLDLGVYALVFNGV